MSSTLKKIHTFFNKKSTEKIFFGLLVLIGLIPLLFSKYYLTLDGPAHLYSGNLIKEMILGNHSEYYNLFKFNSFPVPNWISHFLFAISNLIFPDFISEKIALGMYLVLFPLFFRKTVLWFKPDNKILSYFGVLFAHNHLLYFGFYNFVLALAFFFVSIYYVLVLNDQKKVHFTFILSVLFLLTYFSHVLVLLITYAIAVLFGFAHLHVQKVDNKYVFDNYKKCLNRVKLILIAMVPSLILTILYLVKVDSLEEAKHLSLQKLMDWFSTIRPMLTLSMNAPWNIYTRILFGFFAIMLLSNAYLSIKKTIKKSENTLSIDIPYPRISWIFFLVFGIFLALYFIVPNSNLLTERLILLVFIFLGFWMASLSYSKWVQIIFGALLLLTHIRFSVMHTESMRSTSRQIQQMAEVGEHVKPGSLLLPFNFAVNHNWLHNHSPGYFGSNHPIIVIENYEAQLAWFPLKWNLDGPYKLDKINVWGTNNRKLIDSFYTSQDYPNSFSLPLQNGGASSIPYVVVYGRVREDQKDNHEKIMEIVNKGYSLVFENELCRLYMLNTIQ